MLYLERSGTGLVGWLKTEAQVNREKKLLELEETPDPNTGERSRQLMTMPYDDYLETPEWKVTRKKALLEAEYRCQLCNKAGMLEVHHRTYERRGVEPMKDLIALCVSCHRKFHDVEQAG